MIAMAAAVQTVEVLHFQPESGRTARMFSALVGRAAAHGLKVRVSHAYNGGSDLLMLWGPGAPDRFGPMREQLATGGHVLAWDLAYWDRDRKLRVSIDAAHPQAWVMRRDLPAGRLRADGLETRDAWNPFGPVIVAGIGAKARVQYGADVVDAWEHAQAHVAGIRSGLPMQYRPKREAPGRLPMFCSLAPAKPIGRLLEGASAVITYHSNVAVDAIRLGIPVICADGAAAAVCPSRWPDEGRPEPLAPAVRDRFLSNLAWFQWSPEEAGDCWRFLMETLS